MTLFWLLPLIILLGLALITITNVLSFPRLAKQAQAQASAPVTVSLLVPARNEAGKISETVRCLLAQEYPYLEVLVLDDQSDDATAAEARQAAADNPRFRLLCGEALPSGWLGKNWACQQLAAAARGDILIFTDADVRWEPGALSAVLEQMQHQRADLLTVWPTQQTITWGERLVVPLMTFVILAYLPELAVRNIPWPIFAAANGQCLAFRRAAYHAIGGHAAVQRSVLDDMTLAWAIKRARLRLVMALGAGQIWARMYTGWVSVRAGFAKNILAGHGGKPFLLVLSALFHWTLFLLPWAWLLLGTLAPGLAGHAWPGVPAALMLLGLGIRLLSAAATRHRLADAFLLPVSIVLMTLIAAQALAWHWRGAATWKGRPIARL
jgi:chlorobactene glucosyltransferase